MRNTLNDPLDSQLIEPENQNKRKEKILLRINWVAVALMLIGVCLKIFHLPGANSLLLISSAAIFVVAVLRFYFAVHKTIEVIGQLVVNLLVVLWIVSSVFYIPFRNEIKYTTIAAILINSIFLRKYKKS